MILIMKIMTILVGLTLGVFGVFLVATLGDRLIEYARRGLFGIPPPMPKEGTTARKLLVGFYKTVGIIALAMSVFMIFMLFTHTSK
ncbi:MAG: hypothetical protein GY774_35985 [Planctomycetes bacterium]|nr:hypothetical protein [Planctomycetota bacterium]